MGWGGATDLFDGAVDVCLHFIPKSAQDTLLPAVVELMYRNVEWDDWDTQDESKYADILNRVRVKYGELDPEDIE